MRFFEFVKDLSHSKQIVETMESKGIIDYCLLLYEKSNQDLLEKLNVVEILKEWVQNKQIQQLLRQKNVFSELKQEALVAQDDLYLQVDLIIVALELFNSSIEPYDVNYMHKVMDIIK